MPTCSAASVDEEIQVSLADFNTIKQLILTIRSPVLAHPVYSRYVGVPSRTTSRIEYLTSVYLCSQLWQRFSTIKWIEFGQMFRRSLYTVTVTRI